MTAGGSRLHAWIADEEGRILHPMAVTGLQLAGMASMLAFGLLVRI